MELVPGVEDRVVLRELTGLLDDAHELGLEGVALGGDLRHPWIVDVDRVVERGLRGVDAVGFGPQLGMEGQDEEAARLEHGTERTEDALGDQQGVQVVLAQRAPGGGLEATGDDVVRMRCTEARFLRSSASCAARVSSKRARTPVTSSSSPAPPGTASVNASRMSSRAIPASAMRRIQSSRMISA
jgi:hypothetical protein